jgi:hypothetical protein
LTWRLLGEDVTASKTFRDFSKNIDAGSKKAEASVDSLDKRSKETAAPSGGVGLLTTALVGLGPAVVPLGAAAAGAFLGLAGAGGVALLTVQGIKAAMAQGTPVGIEYAEGVSTFKAELAGLERTGANTFLPGFNAALRETKPLFGPLNQDVAVFSRDLGQVAGNVVPGLVAGFHQANPLFQTFGLTLVDASAQFKTWATGSNAVARFAAYAQTQLPMVESTVKNLVQDVGHLAVSLQGMGAASVSGLHLLAEGISAIPQGALNIAVPEIAGLAIGVKALNAASQGASGLADVASKMKTAGGVAAEASPLVGNLSKVVGFLGPVGLAAGAALGIAAIGMGKHAAAAQADQMRVNDLTQAIIADNGALGDNTRAALVNALQSQGAYDKAMKFGISQKTLTDALLGNKSALGEVNTAMGYYSQDMSRFKDGTASASQRNLDFIDTLDFLKRIMSGTNSEINRAVSAAQNVAAAMKQSTASASSMATQVSHLKAALDAVPKRLGITVSADTSEAIAALQSFVSEENAAQAAAVPIIGKGIQYSSAPPGSAHGHASGGFLDAGLSLVGEQGPELVSYVPGASPRVFTSSETRTVASGGGTTINLTVHAGMGTDGYSVGMQVVSALERYVGHRINTRKLGT